MKRTMALAITPILAFTLAACGGDDGDSSGAVSGHSVSPSSAPTTAQPQAGPHNDQDVIFAQMMIPHHQQAIEMARLAKTRASMTEVKQLATEIEGAQDPEIKTMTGWLTSWGASVPSGGMEGMEGMDHGGGADGMMTEQEMQRLTKLSGMAFDKAFLEMMIKHHQGAITMAKEQQKSGQFPAAKTLAGNVVTTQSAEINKMRDLLNKM